jgi:hypothetical protein
MSRIVIVTLRYYCQEPVYLMWHIVVIAVPTITYGYNNKWIVCTGFILAGNCPVMLCLHFRIPSNCMKLLFVTCINFLLHSQINSYSRNSSGIGWVSCSIAGVYIDNLSYPSLHTDSQNTIVISGIPTVQCSMQSGNET